MQKEYMLLGLRKIEGISVQEFKNKYNIDNPKINDIIVFENTGAYSVMEGMSLFLSRNLPVIYLYNKDKKLCIVRDSIDTYSLNNVR